MDAIGVNSAFSEGHPDTPTLAGWSAPMPTLQWTRVAERSFSN